MRMMRGERRVDVEGGDVRGGICGKRDGVGDCAIWCCVSEAEKGWRREMNNVMKWRKESIMNLETVACTQK